MKFDFLIPYIQYLVFILIGVLLLYIRTLIKEKTKINVLKKENKLLTEETEEIKKKHQLDIEKRKYQYESKKEQFVRFFKLLDEFNTSSNSTIQEQMSPIIDEFNRNYLSSVSQSNKKAEIQAITIFQKKTQNLVLESNKELARIKQETNTIRLIASDSILQTLDLLESAYDLSFKESTSMLNQLPTQILSKDEHGMKNNQFKIQATSNLIQKYKNDLIQKMRVELSEI